MTDSERRFTDRTIRRKRVFLQLSALGVIVGLGLAAHLAWRWSTLPDSTAGLQFVIIVLVLLNGRQNLRQFRYAGILEKLSAASAAERPQTDAS